MFKNILSAANCKYFDHPQDIDTHSNEGLLTSPRKTKKITELIDAPKMTKRKFVKEPSKIYYTAKPS